MDTTKHYCDSITNYKRRPAGTISIGDLKMGSDHPISLQSMTNTDTNDTLASVDQIIRIIEAGSDLVRLTAQGTKEAENLKNIHQLLREKGFSTPLVADIHFNSKAAEVAARYVEKVRVNPGNYVDGAKSFKDLEYTDESYQEELEKIKNKFVPLINLCKEKNTTLRIGVNHGSLSDRIMSRYGDTPEGMVESCMEFLRIAKEENFPNVAISLKSSNTRVMIYSVRLLIQQMRQEEMNYPFHLGVTEAGDGEDGRIKSAVGIGTLLADGIGDTIRVSLSEDPELEIPVAKKLVDYVTQREGHTPLEEVSPDAFSPYSYQRRESKEVENIGGHNTPVVLSDLSHSGLLSPENITLLKTQPTPPEYIYIGTQEVPASIDFPFIQEYREDHPIHPSCHPCFNASQLGQAEQWAGPIRFIKVTTSDLTQECLDQMKELSNIVILLDSKHLNTVGERRLAFAKMKQQNCLAPVILLQSFRENNDEDLQVKAGADLGALFMDGLGNGLMVSNQGSLSLPTLLSTSFGILQAARMRTTKTEYISCPSCGRTLFDLQETIAGIKEKTSHLKGLKIGIMGCIVNGPGEMADADYGYVGAGRGKVSLYKQKECVARNIPSEEAVERLINLIKENGDWVDPKI